MTSLAGGGAGARGGALGAEPLVRGHAAWALGRIGTEGALRGRLEVEVDGGAREEIARALTENVGYPSGTGIFTPSGSGGVSAR